MTLVMFGYQSLIFEGNPYDTYWEIQSTTVYSVILVVVYLKLLIALKEPSVLGYGLLILVNCIYVLILTIMASDFANYESLRDMDSLAVQSFQA